MNNMPLFRHTMITIMNVIIVVIVIVIAIIVMCCSYVVSAAANEEVVKTVEWLTRANPYLAQYSGALEEQGYKDTK